jgi:hypothetical protein
MGSNGYMMVDGVQRIYDGGWDPSSQSVNSKPSKSNNVYMDLVDLEHCLNLLHLEPTHQVYCTGYTWNPLTGCSTTVY